MSSPVEQIKDRLPILDVISSYIKVEKSGKNFKAKCPFHNEKTASFFISPERNSYYCFGCGAKGDVFSFVESFEGVDFMGALKMLSERAGIVLDPKNAGRPDPNGRIYAAVKEAVAFFRTNFEENNTARDYVRSRGITEATVKNFSLGWAQGEWRALFDHLSKKGFRTDEIIRAGLAKQKMDDKGVTGSHPYDVFRERVMFPIFDASGRAVAFSGRILGKGDEHTPKYVNSPETPIFKKSEILYGFDRAKQSIRQYNFSILVEGQIDLVMTHQAGFTNTVASMGTAITPFHMERLKRISGNIVIALDADDAGVASALKTAKIAITSGMDVKVAVLPEGKDPADVVQEDKEKWKESVRTAKHVIDFLLERILAHEKDSRKAKQRVTRELLPYVALIENGIDQAHFITRIASALGIDDAIVAEEVRKIPQGDIELPRQKEEPAKANSPRYDRLTRILYGILLWKEREEKPDIDPEILRADLTRILTMSPDTLYPLEERDAIAFEAEVAYQESAHIDRHIKEMLTFLEEHALKEELTRAMAELTRAEREGKGGEAPELLEKCREITKRLNTLQSHS